MISSYPNLTSNTNFKNIQMARLGEALRNLNSTIKEANEAHTSYSIHFHTIASF